MTKKKNNRIKKELCDLKFFLKVLILFIIFLLFAIMLGIILKIFTPIDNYKIYKTECYNETDYPDPVLYKGKWVYPFYYVEDNISIKNVILPSKEVCDKIEVDVMFLPNIDNCIGKDCPIEKKDLTTGWLNSNCGCIEICSKYQSDYCRGKNEINDFFGEIIYYPKEDYNCVQYTCEDYEVKKI